MSENPMQGLDAINVEAHRGRRGKSPAPRNNNNPINISEETMNNNNNPAVPSTQPSTQPTQLVKTPGSGFASGLDTGLSGFDVVSGYIGELLVPAAAGAGIGLGIVKLAGSRLPAKYAIPVMIVSAIVMVGTKLTIQYVAANAVRRSGNLPANERWDIARASQYIDIARRAGLSDDVIFTRLKAAGAPVAEGPVQAAA